MEKTSINISTNILRVLSKIILILGLWFIFSNISSFSNYIPNIRDVFGSMIKSRNILTSQLLSTSNSAIKGFTFGVFFAIAFNLMLIVWPPLRGFFTFISFAVYSIPLIAVAPIAALIFGPESSGVVLGCIGSYLPIFIAGLDSSNSVPRGVSSVLKGFGASRINDIIMVRIPLAVRGWIIGAQAGWVWAVLGALIGDFTGNQSGLGTFLVGSLVQGNASKVWAIVILCLSLSAIGLLIVRTIGKYFISSSFVDPIDSKETLIYGGWKVRSILISFTFIFVFLAGWQVLSMLLDVEGFVFASPKDIISLSVQMYKHEGDFSYEEIFSALKDTWVLATFGIFLSICLALVLAVIRELWPFISTPIVAVLDITQVTPIVAFVPIIGLCFGRGSLSIIFIVILSTIYPAFLIFFNSFKDVPYNAVNLVKGFGGGKFEIFSMLKLPYAMRVAVIALKLVIARAMLGAITAEYLLTGTGLGGLLGRLRVLLDFRLIWLVCLLIAFATGLTILFINLLIRFNGLMKIAFWKRQGLP